MLLFLSFWITDIFQKYEPVTRDFLKKKIITDKKTFLAIKQNIEKEDSINLIFYLINRIKIISGYFLKYFLIRYFLALYIIPDSYAQPLTSFRPFDWTLYKASGTINSFTEGYTFIYIGTGSGGIKRFNFYGNYFDSPISTAQGLEDNKIDAIHFDKITGLLWASSPGYIQYSFSREGNWFLKTFQEIGLSKFDKVTKIGSSDKYLWLKARSSYVKLEHSSGIMVGIYPVPDEMNINWSSGEYGLEKDYNNSFTNFNIFDGWLFNGEDLIDRNGTRKKITSVFSSQYGDIYVGSENGMIFYGSKTMETLTPIIPDISNEDVLSFHFDNNYMWIGSQNYLRSKGISKLDVKTLDSYLFNFNETINMEPSPIYSIVSSGHEVWAGGEGTLLYFNEKKSFWKTLDYSTGILDGNLWDLCIDNRYLWIGTSRGLNRLEIATHSIDLSGLEKYFNNTQVYTIEKIENEIWIGSKVGLFIYSSDDPKLINARDLQKRPNLINNFFNFTVIKKNNNNVYVAGDLGIAKYDMTTKEWELVSSSAVYGGEIVNSMAVGDQFLFLGTRSGLYRINIKTGLIRDYKYPFIGEINDLVLDENILWIGSANGLLKFKWKRDL